MLEPGFNREAVEAFSSPKSPKTAASKECAQQADPVGLHARELHEPEELQRLHGQAIVSVPRDHRSPTNQISVSHFIERLPRAEDVAALGVHVDQRGGHEEVASAPETEGVLVEQFPYPQVGEGGAGPEREWEGELVGTKAGGEEGGVEAESDVEAASGGAGADSHVEEEGRGAGDGAEEWEGGVEEAEGEVGEGGGREEGGDAAVEAEGEDAGVRLLEVARAGA